MTARRLRPVRTPPLGESGPARHGGPGSADDTVVDALLVAAGRGDLGAFATFYDATASRVLGLFRQVLDRDESAEDLTAELYLALWRDAPAFDPRVRSAEATLLRAARRALVGPIRRRLASTGDRRLRPENAP